MIKKGKIKTNAIYTNLLVQDIRNTEATAKLCSANLIPRSLGDLGTRLVLPTWICLHDLARLMAFSEAVLDGEWLALPCRTAKKGSETRLRLVYMSFLQLEGSNSPRVGGPVQGV